MLLDNTQAMRGAVKTPVTQLKRMGYRGMMGLGETPLDANASSIMTAVNAEIAWLTNLYRANRGLPPLPENISQPGMRFGLEPNTLLLLGGGLLLFLIARRR